MKTQYRKRLLDEILSAYSWNMPDWYEIEHAGAAIRELKKSAISETVPVVDIQDAFFYRCAKPDLQISDLQTIRPPWKDCFMEFSSNEKEGIVDIVVHVVDLEPYCKVACETFFRIRNLKNEFKLFHFGLVSSYNEGNGSPAGGFAIYEGSLFPPTLPIARLEISDFTMRIGNCPLVAFIAINFINCKNVTTKTIIPPIALSKKHRRRHGVDLVKYRILEIPGSGGHQSSVAPGDTLYRLAFHLCRGHFRTVTRPFGREIDSPETWWVSPHTRGNKSSGVVLKDYFVKTKRG